MIIGLEYVVAAYGIWVCTFIVYILLTKRRMKIAGQTVEALKQRVSDSADIPEITGDIENQN
ncbi:MAG: hypothetical protein MAG581_00265 [Deltaproteobacteria bacterium]|jgi:hypothetical protein|nr:hypothetical protein [Deltaproteobacteria bacterium]